MARVGQECGAFGGRRSEAEPLSKGRARVRGAPETMAVLDWTEKATPPSELRLAQKLRPLCPIRLTFVDFVRES